MPSFVDVVSGASALASDVQQIIDALKGTSGKGVPLSPTAVNDGVNFALAVRNNDAGASKTAIFYKADGSVLLQIDKNGVVASPDGTAGAAPLVTTTGTQTITNKTLTAPHMTAPVVDSGGLTITAGGLTVTAGGLTITAGTATLVDLIVANGVANPASSGANNAIRLPNNQRLAFRNAANSGDDYLAFDTSDRLVIQGVAAAATATNGSGAAALANIQEYLTVVYNGNIRKIALFAN